MTLFEDREKQHEKQFGDEQKLHFRASSLALREVATMIAEMRHLDHAEGEAYASSLVDLQVALPETRLVLDKIFADIQEYQVDLSRHRIQVLFDQAYDEARTKIWNGLANP